jgi:hypothetical protein
VAAFNPNDAVYQRERQRLQAQNLNSPGKRIGNVLHSQLAAKHAGSQLARQLEFEKLALQKKTSDQSYKMAEAGLANQRAAYNLKHRAYRDQAKDMNNSVLFGFLGLGSNYIAGEHRKRLLAEQNAREKARQLQTGNIMTMLANRRYRPINPAYYSRGGE